MSRRQHLWLRVGALAVIVGLQLLPHRGRNASKEARLSTPPAAAAASEVSPALASVDP